MRTVYQEQMRTFAHDLSLMSDRVRTMMSEACLALFDADIEKAETVLSSIDGVEELRKKAEQTSFELLALEGPVARDLRQVVSGTYIVEDLARMAALAVHVARTARRHHPDHTLPEQIEPYFREMARLTDEIGAKLHEHMFQLTTKREWP